MAGFDINKYINIIANNVKSYEEIIYNMSSELIIVLCIISLALIAFFTIVNWKMSKKMGLHGWICLIPIYNIIALLKKIGMSLWNVITIFIPIVQIFVYFEIIRNLCASFGKGKVFTFFTAILPFFMIPIMAFGSSSYIYDLSKKEDNQDKNSNNVDSEYLYCPKCNTRLAQNAHSCFICGYKLNEDKKTSSVNEHKNVNNISVGAKDNIINENNIFNVKVNDTNTNLELNMNNINQSSNINSISNIQEPVNNNLLVSDVNTSILNNDTNNNQGIDVNNNNFFNDSMLNSENKDITLNNVSSIEDMFNFHYDNINGSNNVGVNNESPINVNSNGFMPVDENQDSNNLISTENNNVLANLTDNSIPELDSNVINNDNEEILDFNIIDDENTGVSENTEILDFPTSELDLNNNVEIQNTKTEESNLIPDNNQSIEKEISDNNQIIEDVIPEIPSITNQEILSNSSQNDIQKNASDNNYRVCPICGSKVLPNATNCVICGSKVS